MTAPAPHGETGERARAAAMWSALDRALDGELQALRDLRAGIAGLRSIAATPGISGDLARHGLHYLARGLDTPSPSPRRAAAAAGPTHEGEQA